MMHTFAIATVVLSLVPEGSKRVLIGADLSRQSVVIDRIDAASIGVVDARGVRRTVAARDVLAVYAESIPRRIAVEGARAVGLVDGQVLLGTLGAVGGDADSLLVRHPVLGDMRIALDQTLWIAGADAPAMAATTGDDAIVLANGDLLTGFVGGIVRRADGGISVEFEGASGATQLLGMESMLSMLIANGIEAPLGPRVWLADGTSVALREIVPASGADAGILRVKPVLGVERTDTGRVTESEPTEDTLAGTEALSPHGTLVLEHVIGWMPDAGRMVALAGLKVMSVEPVPPRPWTEGPMFGDAARSALGAPDVLLPGPSRIEWELPAGADGLSCEVMLPEAYRDWGDCEVVILTGGGAGGGTGGGAGSASGPLTERWRGRVNAENPTLPVALEMTDRPRRLIVAVEPGAFGPVQDRPTLVTPLIRVSAIR